MAIHKRLPIGKLGMFGFCAALLIMPRFAAAQCGMMGGGGHDHGDTQEQDSEVKASAEDQVHQSIDLLLSDEQGRMLLADALLADEHFMHEFIVRLMADPEWESLVTRIQTEGSFDSDAAVPMTADRQSATYTCPMHSGVKSSAPGECPRCSMRLVRAKS